MLEVGVSNTQGHATLLNYLETRSHFGLWCIASTPLILGFDLNNSTAMDSVWEIITNREVIRVNQEWAGFAGADYYSSPDNTTFPICGWGDQGMSSNATV